MRIQMLQVTGLLAALAGKIGTNRMINTTDGITGGGDLSVNRTIGLTGINLFLHNMNANGVLVRTGVAATPLAVREIRGTAGHLTVADSSGAQGNPTISLVNSGVQAGIGYNRFSVDQFGRVTAAEAIDYVVNDANYFQGTLNAKPLLYANMGSAAPVLGTTRSLGLRVAFRNSTGPSIADLGIGADTAGLWIGLEAATTSNTLKFYGGASLIGTLNGAGDLSIIGNFSAATKSFAIPHPTKENVALVHGCLEGPEHAVYCRGMAESDPGHGDMVRVNLPEYWRGLVHEESLTVHLTPHTPHRYWVKAVRDNQVQVVFDVPGDIKAEFSYLVMGTRRDVPLLKVEQEKNYS